MSILGIILIKVKLPSTEFNFVDLPADRIAFYKLMTFGPRPRFTFSSIEHA
jgi:hypothetical protein